MFWKVFIPVGNQTFYGCTIFQSENGNPWCSTKVDPLDHEHISGKGYYGDCPLPLDECPSAEQGLEAENNYIEYLDLSKYAYHEVCINSIFDCFKRIVEHLHFHVAMRQYYEEEL